MTSDVTRPRAVACSSIIDSDGHQMDPIIRGVARTAAIGAAALLVSCATAVLLPGPGAHVLPGAESIAVDEVAGIRLTVQADAWPGDRRVPGRVQPMRITIENRSAATVRVRYGDFAIVSGTHRYPALPPVRVEGELLSPMLASGVAPIRTPGFSYHRFYVAPYFARLYPGVPVYGAPYLFYDPDYYAFWSVDFARAVRPSVEVLSLALPEGVIEPEGRVSGFLYFRTLDPDAGTATFRTTLIALRDGVPIGGGILGEIAIPFVVQKRR